MQNAIYILLDADAHPCEIILRPRLIGFASGTFGAALAAAFAAQLFLTSNSAFTLQSPALSIPMICGCVLLFLAFPLFAAREWARKACLLLAIYLTLAALAISFSLMVVQRSATASHAVLWLLIGACTLVAVLIPPGFILAVLHHADIRRAFQDPNASNQAMERTADRPVFTLEMTFTFSLRAMRVLVRRRSSCSR